MPAPILYCGDTNLEGAASYLAGLMAHGGWTFDYLPSHESLSRDLLKRRRSLIVLSDYPAARFDRELQQVALQHIQRGTGLLMIGGWESFRGSDGRWQGTPLGDALPVEIDRRDDRVNFPQPTLLSRAGEHATIDGLPWKEQPPTIGGLNRVQAKEGSNTLLAAVSYKAF
jgi:uncharacterized membrane protein